MKSGGNFPLGKRLSSVESVTPGDDHALGVVKLLPHDTTQLFAFDRRVDVVRDGVLDCDNIHKRQHVSVAVGVNRLVDGNVEGAFFAAAEVHEYCILNTGRRVGGKFRAFLRSEGVHRLDQSDGADGDQVVPVRDGAHVLFADVRHQPQIVLDQLLPCRPVSGDQLFYIFSLLSSIPSDIP